MALPHRRAARVTLLPAPEAEPDLSGALCRDVPDPDVFFPEDGDELGVARAKRICVKCPVRSACLALALERSEPHGVFGGLDPVERRRLRRSTAGGERAGAA
ncbi:hypothetical protein GCM10010495_66050 [Kitasatospora herbaricolor]|uniref:WhiB family transcriptional regulator n=1 Tax=Kitasatospora herbaricolor TaxID=68217 RepID=UPI00174AE2EB|nr:WhiB family transcriptional regulator [Kitasatospora herbaricolor]MDQ0307959.1 WhiB family redox-sensing transcriptional regulator [Kitasatospora herbaricolor]GGV39487.1 hypothetical protein GCM10010495_66050 [Kitasatospora herbaricolor]